jgi:hypothetical protein
MNGMFPTSGGFEGIGHAQFCSLKIREVANPRRSAAARGAA